MKKIEHSFMVHFERQILSEIKSKTVGFCAFSNIKLKEVYECAFRNNDWNFKPAT